MGYRIHCSPVYQVTYGNGYFSHHTAEINRLLQDNCEDISFDGEDIECAERLIVSRTDLTGLIQAITNDREGFAKWLESHSIDYSPDEFIKIVCEWIVQSDQRNEYVVLTWF